ncbi:MAG: hypothetical protein WC476_00850 [Phycisphaerae bacterium]|jgi:hypothetical protein
MDGCWAENVRLSAASAYIAELEATNKRYREALGEIQKEARFRQEDGIELMARQAIEGDG